MSATLTRQLAEIVVLRERTAAAPGRVDVDKGRISDVRILGANSANGRTYTQEAIANAVGLYENIKVYADHPRHGNADRSIRDAVGWLENVRVADGGLRGDLCLYKNHKMTPVILEAAERNPSQFGLSHNAEGHVVKRDGKIFVEEIRAVRSVDIVSDPATTRGLFESCRHTPEFSTQQFVEALRGRGPLAAWLTEEDIPAIADAPVEVAGAKVAPGLLQQIANAVQRVMGSDGDEKWILATCRKLFAILTHHDVERLSGEEVTKRINGIVKDASDEPTEESHRTFRRMLGLPLRESDRGSGGMTTAQFVRQITS